MSISLGCETASVLSGERWKELLGSKAPFWTGRWCYKQGREVQYLFLALVVGGERRLRFHNRYLFPLTCSVPVIVD